MVEAIRLKKNIRFLETLKCYPSLWNPSYPESNHPELLEEVWCQLAKQLSSKPAACRQRWRGIKEGLSRGRRNPVRDLDGNLLNSYYLAKYLDFYEPYLLMKNQVSIVTEECVVNNIPEESAVNNVPEESIINNVSEDSFVNILTEDSDNSSSQLMDEQCEIVVEKQDISNISIEGDQVEEKSPNEESAKEDANLMNKSASSKALESVKEDTNLYNKPDLKKKKTEKNNNNKSNDSNRVHIEWVKKKKDADGNQSFLNSLRPYLRDMTDKQNRRFQQKVITLIDEILDDIDIPQVIFHSLPTEPISEPAEYSPEETLHQVVNADKQFIDLTERTDKFEEESRNSIH